MFTAKTVLLFVKLLICSSIYPKNNFSKCNYELARYLFSATGMSLKTAQCIYEKSLEVPFFHISNVFMTGFVAQACHIPRKDLDIKVQARYISKFFYKAFFSKMNSG